MISYGNCLTTLDMINRLIMCWNSHQWSEIEPTKGGLILLILAIIKDFLSS